jgi:integrase/recombinase XerC
MSDLSGYKSRRNIVNEESIKKITKENLTLWEEYKRDMILIKGKDAEKTIQTYKSAVLAFLIWLSDNYGEMKFIDIDHKIFKNYLYYCQEELGNHGKIRNTKTSAVSSLLNYCVREDYIKYNPLDKKLKRADISNEQMIDQPYLTEEQVQEIRDKIEEIEDYEKKILFNLIFELGFSTASRVAAWEQFSEDNLELENRRFVGIREKRGKIKELYFSVRGKDLLAEWIEYKKENGIDTPAIFVSRHNGKFDFMSYGNLQKLAKEIGMLIGVNAHSHTLRKSYSNISKSKGAPIEDIQEKLGHEDPGTTIKFYTKKDGKKNQEKLDKYEI